MRRTARILPGLVVLALFPLVLIAQAPARPRPQAAPAATAAPAQAPADDGMKFALTFWIPEPDGMDKAKSEAMLALWDAFKREGIHVPYPVREIRVRHDAPAVETIVEGPQ